jgi:hypothetical protein
MRNFAGSLECRGSRNLLISLMFWGHAQELHMLASYDERCASASAQMHPAPP